MSVVSSSCCLLSFPLLCLPHDTSHGFCSAAQRSPAPCFSPLSVCSPCMHGHWKENSPCIVGREEREMDSERDHQLMQCKDHSVTGGSVYGDASFSPSHTHLLPSISLTRTHKNTHDCFFFLWSFLYIPATSQTIISIIRAFKCKCKSEPLVTVSMCIVQLCITVHMQLCMRPRAHA